MYRTAENREENSQKRRGTQKRARFEREKRGYTPDGEVKVSYRLSSCDVSQMGNCVHLPILVTGVIDHTHLMTLRVEVKSVCLNFSKLKSECWSEKVEVR